MSPNTFTLTPTAWDAYDRLCAAYSLTQKENHA